MHCTHNLLLKPFMKIPSSALTLLFAMLLFTPALAGDTLWKLDFKDLKAGDTPTAIPYTPSCAGPQSVAVDAQNTLAAKAVGPLHPALQFVKASNAKYMPGLTLKANSPFTTGVIIVEMDVVFDQVTPADHPVETLMAMPFLAGNGGSTFVLLIACSGPGNLFLGGAGLDKPKTPLTFPTGTAAHVKAVLDLNQHTFQAFLNDTAMNPPEHDDTKFASFLGLSVRDGTALGGNSGATFSAGIANLTVTHN